MKAVLLAGGLGTRISEETTVRPKPMVEVGGMPILWHIMKMYSQHGIDDFVVCCGYKGDYIKEWFANYYLKVSDITFDLKTNALELHHTRAENWRVTLVDTGAATMTGGRLRRVREHIGDETFCLTYGDGVSDVNITDTIAAHRAAGRDATMTAVLPPGRFGVIAMKPGTDEVMSFSEKPKDDGAWINGGFFVLEPRVIDRIDDDSCVWEQAPLRGLAADGQLTAYRHSGFWQPMDTLRDRQELETLWASGNAPWKNW
jgi:glucose-1-phosphate cytidylyltransferase